eukprot:Pompholyxophrys_punicea_v1_NODE_519_length_1784_cov_2.994795.p1 type:complete len:128 gc:universal NODE_519_length_1784_cov_2.994795:605-988(+)
MFSKVITLGPVVATFSVFEVAYSNAGMQSVRMVTVLKRRIPPGLPFHYPESIIFKKFTCDRTCSKETTPRIGRPPIELEKASDRTIARRLIPIKDFLSQIHPDLLRKALEHFPDIVTPLPNECAYQI